MIKRSFPGYRIIAWLAHGDRSYRIRLQCIERQLQRSNRLCEIPLRCHLAVRPTLGTFLRTRSWRLTRLGWSSVSCYAPLLSTLAAVCCARGHPQFSRFGVLLFHMPSVRHRPPLALSTFFATGTTLLRSYQRPLPEGEVPQFGPHQNFTLRIKVYLRGVRYETGLWFPLIHAGSVSC